MQRSADVVVVGAGTIGGWASYFAAREGADVVVVERDVAGYGASSRAAGIVRAQGGSPVTVELGRWSIDFYNRQAQVLGTDSGFRELGYLLLATTDEDERTGRERVRMQKDAGLDVQWLDAPEATRRALLLAPHAHRGGSYVATDGCIDPSRNVRAYSLAMRSIGVHLYERTACIGFEIAGASGAQRVTGVKTPEGTIATERVIVTGGPALQPLGRLLDARIPVGGVRHQVAVTEPHPELEVERLPMVFDVRAGLYWRPEEGGLLFGMSNPDEKPGPARTIDWKYLVAMRKRLRELCPLTGRLGLRKIWAATIDYTPDHLPILGPAITGKGDVLGGTTVASAGGHGMMWGPAVARIAADLALRGETDVADVSDLGLDRFDEQGRSRLATDPIALPFPTTAGDSAMPGGTSATGP